MTNTSKLIAPALIGLAIFAFAPALAGENKGELDMVSHPGGNADAEKNNGNGETEKVPTPDTPPPHNGGGGEVVKVPTPDTPPPRDGGGGEVVKVPTPDTPPPPAPRPRPPRDRVILGDSGSRGDVVDYHQITCVVNGHVFQARSARECYRGSRSFDGGIGGGGGYGLGGGYAYKFGHGGGYGAEYGRGGVQVYRPRVRHPRVVVGGGFDGGYGYAPQPRIRYYRPASPAAMMQTERRIREGYYGNGAGYAMGGEAFGYGGGYNVQGGYGDGYVKHRKRGHKARHARRMRQHGGGYGYEQMQGGYGYGQAYEQGFSYDPGVVLHYGPTITKDGGY
jgi:hypothetical protein